MNIYEAAKIAIANDKCITSNSRLSRKEKIKPTNKFGNCKGIVDGKVISKYGWQPCADDLIAVDWEVVD